MEKLPKVSVIIPTMKGREELLKRLISTIPKDCEIIVVDDEDLLLAAKRNKGAKQARGEYFLFIDDDNYLEDGAINWALTSFIPYTGIVGFIAYYHDRKNFVADGGSLRNLLTGFTKGVNTNLHREDIFQYVYEVDEVANAFMIHSELFYELHGFDEDNFPIDLDEADLCKRVKNLGYSIKLCTQAICYHKSQTYSAMPDFRRPMNAYYMGRNKVLYQKKHLKLLKYGIYLILFLPLHILVYSFSLFYRGKPKMVYHFLRGIKDGVFRTI